MYPNRREVNSVLKKIWLWRGNRRWMWIESAIITLAILIFCYYFNPKNPLFLHEAFPWPWIAGVIVVLQYGLGPGLLSTVMITSAAILYKDGSYFSLLEFQNYLVSGMVLLIICAMFSTNWLRRTINAEELLIYTNERLDSLSSSYYSLRLSYDYLEQNIITKPYTLRSVMVKIQQLGAANQGKITNQLAYQFLQILVQYCSINSVGMYLFEKNKLRVEPISEVGPAGKLDLNDPLIKKSLDMKDIHYVTLNHLESAVDYTYLVSIPMVSNDNQFYGLIVIKDMSFWTLNNETLTTLSVLVSYFIEDISTYRNDPALFSTYPDCPSDFARQLKKLLFLNKKLQIDSALCAIIIPKSFRHYNVIDNLKRQRRLLDVSWILCIGDDDILITLMPFTNATGVHGYFARMTNYIKINLGLSYSEAEIKMPSMQLYQSEPLPLLENFIHFIRRK